MLDDRALRLCKVPTQCQQAAVPLVSTLLNHPAASARWESSRMIWEIAGAQGICLEVHYPVPEFAFLAGGDWILRILRSMAALQMT